MNNVIEGGIIIESGSYDELINNNSSRMNEFIKMQEL